MMRGATEEAAPRWAELLARNTSALAAVGVVAAGVIYKSLHPNVLVFSAGMVFALVWLVLASLLIGKARGVTEEFFLSIRAIVLPPESWSEIRDAETSRMQSHRHLLFSIPLMVAAAILPFLARFGSTMWCRAWAAVVLAAVFFYAGIAYWGLWVVRGIIRRLTSADLRMNAFDPDSAGGIGRFEQFVRTATTFYASGGLLVPAAYELIRGRAAFLGWMVAASYFGLGVVGYFIDQNMIVEAVSKERGRLLSEIASRLKELIDSNGGSQEIQTLVFYQAAAQKMRHSVFTLRDTSQAGVRTVVSALPVVVTHLHFLSQWLQNVGAGFGR